MDSNSIILYLEDPFNHPFYATIVKTKIQGNEVILATKNIETWVFGNTLKEMAYFYKDLFNHFGRL